MENQNPEPQNLEQQTEEPQELQMMSPEEVESVIIITDDECTPCQMVQEHLEKMEKEGAAYTGVIEVIDPASEEADRFLSSDEFPIPTAVVRKKDGTETPCDIFIDKDTFAIRCEDKLLVLNDAPPEIREAVETMVEEAKSAPPPAAEAPASPTAEVPPGVDVCDLPSPP